MICTIDGEDENFFRTESFFCLADQLQFFQLPPVLGAGRDQVDSGRREARVAEDVGEFDHVVGLVVEGLGEEVAEIVGEDFPRFDAGLFAEGFHFRPDLFPIDGFAASGEENLAGSDFLFPGVFEELPAKFARE